MNSTSKDEESDDVLIIKRTSYCQAKTKKNELCMNKVTSAETYCSRHIKIFKFDKPTECSICYESLASEPQPLSCGHWIHRKCIFNWGKAECPICRAVISITKAETIHFNTPNEIHNDPIISDDTLNDIINITVDAMIEQTINNMIGNLGTNDIDNIRNSIIYNIFLTLD